MTKTKVRKCRLCRVFLLLVVVKPIGSHSLKLIQSVCQCSYIVVLLVRACLDH